jgi:hypothetical protein
MKLFVAALATVNASVVCPTGWSAGTDATTADDCSPDDVTVTCNSDSMTVKFPVDAVYYEGSTELDTDQLAAAMADVVGQTDTDCIDFAYEATDAGYFTITHDLTACGTDATHENGNLIFSNTYTGDEAALTVDGIVTTKVLSFTAECSYADSAVVAVDGVSVSMGTNLAEEVTGTGEYEFTMTTYDADDVEIDANNAAEIGEAITLKVTPNASLPSNVEFQLIDCTAVSEFDTDGITPVANALTYNILEEGSCVSDLLDAQFTTGRSATEVGLTFNSFTFEAADDELALKCNVKLCLTTDTDCNKAAQKMTAANLDSNDADYFVCDAKYTRSTWWSSL